MRRPLGYCILRATALKHKDSDPASKRRLALSGFTQLGFVQRRLSGGSIDGVLHLCSGVCKFYGEETLNRRKRTCRIFEPRTPAVPSAYKRCRRAVHIRQISVIQTTALLSQAQNAPVILRVKETFLRARV